MSLEKFSISTPKKSEEGIVERAVEKQRGYSELSGAEVEETMLVYVESIVEILGSQKVS